ncbi:MAG TPA: DNA polymerase I, partial [Bacteroidetes bacterium]|nr:DNA polymerase I [Bacteroidota bacterium]
MQKEKKLFLIDGHALVYRSHYAFIRRPLINSKGINTSAITGFVRTLIEIIKNENPDYLAVVFDPQGPTFRHEEYDLYKANRDKQPEDISIAIPYIKKILEAFNVPVITVDRYEADDVIGTLAKASSKRGIITYMVTPDKDYGQLVDDNIYMYRPLGRGEGHEVLGKEDINQKWGINDTKQVIDFLAIQGDASDNIPGVKGIGEKGAQKLIKEFGSLENIYENLDKIKGKAKEYLQNSKDNAFLSKYLATIITDVPVDTDIERFKKRDFDKEKVAEIFKELEFRTLAKSILGNEEKKPVQGSLFGDNVSKQSLFETNKQEKKEYEIVKNNFENSNKHYFLVDSDKEIERLISKLKKQAEFA